MKQVTVGIFLTLVAYTSARVVPKYINNIFPNDGIKENFEPPTISLFNEQLAKEDSNDNELYRVSRSISNIFSNDGIKENFAPPIVSLFNEQFIPDDTDEYVDLNNIINQEQENKHRQPKSGSITADVNKQSGQNPSATVGVKIPVVDKKNTQVVISGSTTVQKGQKPNNQVGISIEHRFD